MRQRNTSSAAKKTLAAAATALIAASSALVGAPYAQAATYKENPEKVGEVTASGHKKRYPTFKQKVILDESLTDTNTEETHVCAGRKLIYQGHADPIYGTYDKSQPEGSQLTSMFVDGQDVVPADTVCARLAPDGSDGDDSTGRKPGDQVSKLVVPDDPAYSFIGEPGQVVWHAPQLIEWSQRPIYAGIGAFDPNHEADGGVPTDFAGGLLHFDITDFTGPGRMSIFFNEGQKPNEIVSVQPRDTLGGEPGDNKSFARNVGAHGHYGWAFTEPGIYRITITPWGDKTDGSREVGTPAELIWLVGSDEEVGLPDGITTGLNKVTSDPGPVGGQSEGSGDTGSSGDTGTPVNPGKGGDEAEGSDDSSSGNDQGSSSTTSPTTSTTKTDKPKKTTTPTTHKPKPGKGSGSSTTEPSESEGTDSQTPPQRNPDPEKESSTWWGGQTKPHIIRKGHMDMALADIEGSRYAMLFDDEDPANRKERASGTFAFALPDAATRQTVPDAWKETFGDVPQQGYYVPMSNSKLNEAPWLGFSTEHVDYGTLKPGAPVNLSIAEFSGPGAMITGHETIGGATIALDSRDLSRTYSYKNRSHDHQFFWFTNEGVYRTVFRYEWTNPDGEVQYQDLEAYFLVGDNAEAAAQKNPKQEDDSTADVNTDEMVCGSGKDCPPPNTGDENSGPGESNKVPQNPGATAGAPIAAPGKGSNGASTNSSHGSSHAGGGSTASGSGGKSGASGGSATAGTAKSDGSSTGGSSVSGNKGAASSAGKTAGSGGSATSTGSSTGVGGSSGSAPVKSAARAGARPATSGAKAAGGKTSAAKSASKTAAKSAAPKRKLPQPGTRVSGSGNSSEAADYEAVEEDKGFFQRVGDMISSTGWLGGLLLGLGIMGLIGGLLFFLSSRKDDEFDQWDD